MPTIACQNVVICRTRLKGSYDAFFVGHMKGYIDADFDGWIDGLFTGRICGFFQGLIVGSFTGVFGDDQNFNGNLNQTVNTYLCGEFGGLLRGTFQGRLTGEIDADVRAQITGILDVLFNGTLDGIPVNPDLPFNNTSAEDPDVPRYFDDYLPPGGNRGICVSPVSQEEAELCAIRNGGTTPPGGNTPSDTDPPTVILYNNSAQTCERVCDGNTVTYTVPAGLFLGFTQIAADTFAMQTACAQVDTYCETGTFPPLFFNTLQTSIVACPSGATSSYIVSAGTYAGTNQTEADAIALEFALAIATIRCPTTTPEDTIPPGGNPPGGNPPVGNPPGGNPIPPTTPPPNLPIMLGFANSIQTVTIPCANGGTFAYSTPAGRFYGASVAAANAMALSYAQARAPLELFCLDVSELEYCAGTYRGLAVQITGPHVSPIWTITNLPPGFGVDIPPEANPLHPYYRTIGSDTNTPAGTYPVLFRITQTSPTSSIPNVLVKTVQIYVGEITTTSLPNGQVGEPYSFQLTGVGFNPAEPWVDFLASLPAGMTLDQINGIIGGTPLDSVSANITIKRGEAVCLKEFRLTTIPGTGCGFWTEGFGWTQNVGDGVPIETAIYSWTPEDLTDIDAFETYAFQDLNGSSAPRLTTIASAFKSNNPMMLRVTVIADPLVGFLGDPADRPYVYFDYDDPYIVMLDAFIEAAGTYDYKFFIPASTVNRDYYFEVSGGYFQPFTGTVNAEIGFSYLLRSYEITVDNSNGWYLFTGIDPNFYFATSTVDNPSTSITIASNREAIWTVDSYFLKSSWAIAPIVTLDGIPVGIIDNGTYWSLNLATIETNNCTIKTLMFSGPTIATPFGLTTNYIHIIPQD